MINPIFSCFDLSSVGTWDSDTLTQLHFHYGPNTHLRMEGSHTTKAKMNQYSEWSAACAKSHRVSLPALLFLMSTLYRLNFLFLTLKVSVVRKWPSFLPCTRLLYCTMSNSFPAMILKHYLLFCFTLFYFVLFWGVVPSGWDWTRALSILSKELYFYFLYFQFCVSV